MVRAESSALKHAPLAWLARGLFCAALAVLAACSNDAEPADAPTAPSRGPSTTADPSDIIAEVRRVAGRIEFGSPEEVAGLLTLSTVDCARASALQSAHTLCVEEGTDEIEAFWLGGVEAVVIPKPAFDRLTENLASRGLRFLAAVRREQSSHGLFPLGDIALVFRANGQSGGEARDTFNLVNGRIVSIQFDNADFSDDELRDKSNPAILVPLE